MYDRHWTDDELVARLYGVKQADAHIDTCESCMQRWEAVQRRRRSNRPGSMEVSQGYLAAQRRAIESRLGRRRPHINMFLVPVMAALILACILVVMRPVPEQHPVVNDDADALFFDEVFAGASATEPSSVGPIRSLFEEQK